MSRRSRQRAAQSPAPFGPALPGESSVRPVSMSQAFGMPGFGFNNGYGSASWTRDRGYIYFPEFDTRKEITSYTRTETLRRVRWLYANVGFPRRVINGISRMVAGTGLMPRSTTTDQEWNKLARQNFDNRVGTAAVYDLGRRYNFYSGQQPTLACRYRDGDMGKALAQSDAGLGRVAFYEAHQIGDGDTSKDAAGTVFDGVRVDRNNAAIAYRVLGTDDTQQDIPIENFIYVGKYERPGQHRCVSILTHAVNNMVDWTEINAALKSGIKASSRVGYYIAKDGSKGGQDIPSLPRRNPGGTASVTNAEGKAVKTETVFDAAGGEIPDLPPGTDIKMLLDERPHPNALGFLDNLARDISWGCDLSPEILWSIASLGGANTRLVLADAQSFVEQEQQFLIDTVLGREYLWFTAKAMKAGQIPQCKDPEWWKHDWIAPARWTVDYGKDGKLHMEQMRSAALSFRRFYGWQGLDAEQELIEILNERAFLKKEAAARGLTMSDIFVSNNPQAPADQGVDPAAEDPKPAADARRTAA